MNNLRACAAAVALAAALVAGCGSADSTDPGPGGTASPAVDENPGEDMAAGGSQPAIVALSFDGQGVPITTSCREADGAVLVTTDGEVTITLVDEEGTALRYDGEGMTAETSDVSVEEVGDFTVYRATLESDEVPPVEVTLEVSDPSALEDCRP